MEESPHPRCWNVFVHAGYAVCARVEAVGRREKETVSAESDFTGANVYLFDELSNDIDIPTLTILEDFLTTFRESSSRYRMTGTFWTM